MTESEIIRMFTDAGFTHRPELGNEDITWFSCGVNNVHVFKSFPCNTYLHINYPDFTFHKRFDLDEFPKDGANAIDLITKIKAIIKLYGK